MAYHTAEIDATALSAALVPLLSALQRRQAAIVGDCALTQTTELRAERAGEIMKWTLGTILLESTMTKLIICK